MLHTIITVNAKVDISEKKQGLLSEGVLYVTADVSVDYERPTDENILKDYVPSIINFNVGDVYFVDLIYLNSDTDKGGRINEGMLSIDDLAMLHVAVEASALDYIQSKIDEYI